MTTREQLSLQLAAHAGEVITREVAVKIIKELFPYRGIDPARFGRHQCGTLTFQAERLADILDEIHPLHEAHWLETEGYQEGIALDIDYERILEDERAGNMIQFTARSGGALVGNLRVYLSRSRHTKRPFAVEDTLFMLAEHRKGRAGLRFMEFAENALRDFGCRELRVTTKLVNKVHLLLEFMGFKRVAFELVKYLKD
jgi:GNAT superfamily N-acetyltransferase